MTKYICAKCGYVIETDKMSDDYKCPMCGSYNIQQLRRVTGYLTGDYKTAFNLGKQQEVVNRHRHSGTELKI